MKKLKFLLLLSIIVIAFAGCNVNLDDSIEQFETPTGKVISKSLAEEAFNLSDEAKNIVKETISAVPVQQDSYHCSISLSYSMI